MKRKCETCGGAFVLAGGKLTCTNCGAEECPHHWELGTPDGSPEVGGKCKMCGEYRMFRVSETKVGGYYGVRK